MEQKLSLVALIGLALCACGEAGGSSTTLADAATAVDTGMTVVDQATPDAGDQGLVEDAGVACVSSRCVARGFWGGPVCISTPQTGASCDDGNASTDNDVCQADGACRGVICECTSGPCCDGCFFRGAGHVCNPMLPTLSVCSSGAVSCGTRGIETRHESVACSGSSAACNGAATAVPGAVVVECGVGEGCFNVNPMPFQAACFECP